MSSGPSRGRPNKWASVEAHFGKPLARLFAQWRLREFLSLAEIRDLIAAEAGIEVSHRALQVWARQSGGTLAELRLKAKKRTPAPKSTGQQLARTSSDSLPGQRKGDLHEG